MIFKTALTTEHVKGGTRLAEAMNKAMLNVSTALWRYNTETETWRLIVATPKLAQVGPRKIYRHIQCLLADLEPDCNITLDDISVVHPESNLIHEPGTDRVYSFKAQSALV